MTRDELLALPPVLDVPTAAAVLGVGRTLAYELVRTGQWPSPVLRMGRLVKIPSAPLVRLLEENDDPLDNAPGGRPQLKPAG